MKQGFTLVELAQELDRQRQSRVDYLVSSAAITCATVEETFVDLGGVRHPESNEPVTGLRLNEVAHIQVADRLDIPKRYYDKLRQEVPDLFDTTINRLLRHYAKDAPPYWMIRTMDGTARAALSNRYKRVDNDAVAEVVMNVLMGSGVTVRTTYVDDRFMHIKATTPELTGRVRGEEVVGGFYVRNSEVGFAKTAIYPFVEEQRCENGLIIPRKDEATLEEPHRGGLVRADECGVVVEEEVIDRQFALRVREVINAAIDGARFRGLVADMERAATSTPLVNPPAAIELLVKREGLSDREGEGIRGHLAARGDHTQWGLVSAVTSTAEDAETFRRATELETLGGRILDYSEADWTALAVAA